ncbi:MAG: response regulator transcription factor [Elusimicrobiota bacterium]|nr:response regulator transcription factor [Elusimicrobiota bacterium]
MHKKILLVDDDRKMLDVMRVYLENHEFSVIFTDNGSEALLLAHDSRPDLIVTDVDMPGLDGFSLCKAIKTSADTAGIPVIIISGKKIKDIDVVSGYDRGADDYLAKPFAFPVLAAKINAVLRRYSAKSCPAANKIKVEGVELDPAARTVKISGKPAALTRKEFDLLTILIEKRGRVLSVPYMLETVWGYDISNYNNPRTVETHVSSLRKKLGAKLAARILTVTGYGYRFE